MYHSDIELKNGAFVVADAHFSLQRPQLQNFIKDIHSNKLQPTQLILMGDIFDALFGEIKLSIEINKEIISLINDISNKIEVIYLEGNHDFNLKTIFPNVKVFRIFEQPIICKYNDKKIALAHGDFDGVLSYKIYTKIVRNRFVLKFLKLFDKALLNKLDNYLDKKNDCKDFIGFKDFISKRCLYKYNCDYFIEGHYHQNKTINYDKFTYINIGAFACNQRYFIVNSSKDKELLREKLFYKGSEDG